LDAAAGGKILPLAVAAAAPAAGAPVALRWMARRLLI